MWAESTINLPASVRVLPHIQGHVQQRLSQIDPENAPIAEECGAVRTKRRGVVNRTESKFQTDVFEGPVHDVLIQLWLHQQLQGEPMHLSPGCAGR